MAQLDQLGDNRPYMEIGWGGILYRWALVPISFQLWFIRSLFVYNLLYPFLKWVVLKYPIIWFCIVVFLWITLANVLFIEGMGLTFFSAGIWLSKRNYPIDKKPEWFSRYICWITFIGLSVIRTFMAFEFESYHNVYIAAMLILQGVTVVAGILAVWFSADAVVKWCMSRKWFVWLTAFSFVIFALHIPLLAYVMRLTTMFVHNMNGYRLLTYIFVPLAVLFFCVVVGALLRKVLPGFYKIATGGRGF